MSRWFQSRSSPHQKLGFPSYDVKGAAEIIRRSNKILFSVGAGISSQYLPDFRTKKIGLYDMIRNSTMFNEYSGIENLRECPEELFTQEFILRYPKLFFKVVEEMKLWPSSRPDVPATDFHKFMFHLQQQNKLLKIITQNVDGLEALAGCDASRVVEAHGSFAQAKCLNDHAADPKLVRETFALKNEIPTCPICGEIQRPSVVLFGENLPDRYFSESRTAVRETDLLIVAGTSLNVYPVAGIPDQVPDNVPRIVINRDNDAHVAQRFNFGERDLLLDGDCQETARELMKELKF
jgi:NAD-dependent SIR2 family protein deacetylase